MEPEPVKENKTKFLHFIFASSSFSEKRRFKILFNETKELKGIKSEIAGNKEEIIKLLQNKELDVIILSDAILQYPNAENLASLIHSIKEEAKKSNKKVPKIVLLTGLRSRYRNEEFKNFQEYKPDFILPNWIEKETIGKIIKFLNK